MDLTELAHVGDRPTVQLFSEQLARLSPHIDPSIGTVALGSEAGQVLSLDPVEPAQRGLKRFSSQAAWLDNNGTTAYLKAIAIKEWWQKKPIIAGYWVVRNELKQGHAYSSEGMTEDEIRAAVGTIATENWVVTDTAQPIRPIARFDPQPEKEIKDKLQQVIPKGWGNDSDIYRAGNVRTGGSWGVNLILYPGTINDPPSGSMVVLRRKYATDQSALPLALRIKFPIRVQEEGGLSIGKLAFIGESEQSLVHLDTGQRAELYALLKETLTSDVLRPKSREKTITIEGLL